MIDQARCAPRRIEDHRCPPRTRDMEVHRLAASFVIRGRGPMRTHGRESMRILAPHSRLRVLLLVFTLLALVPAAANAAPKNVKYRFGATAYSVNEANTTLNVTVLRTGNKSVPA